MGNESEQAKALTAMTQERDEAIKARDAVVGELEAMTADRDTLAGDLEKAKAALDEGQQALTAMAGERDNALSALEAERQDKSQALIDLDKVKTELAAAKRKASVTQKPRGPQLRSVTEMEEVEDKRALLEQVQSGLFEVVFSDGEREIASLPPIAVAPDAWQLIGRGVLLREPVTVKPDRNVQLAGFALFDGEGQQIGWCAMAQSVAIVAGQALRLDRQIVF